MDSDFSLLICERSTRLCGLPPTRPRQTSDPVFSGNANRAFHLPFASSAFDRVPDTHASSGQGFPSGHRDVPVRSTISGRSASGVFSESDGSVERDCVFDAHFPRFSRKDHHQPTLSHSIAFKNPTIPERCDFVTRCGSAPTAAVAMTRFQVSREYYYWLENHLRSSFRSDVATTPFVRNVPQTFHACTLSRVDLYISFHLSI